MRQSTCRLSPTKGLHRIGQQQRAVIVALLSGIALVGCDTTTEPASTGQTGDPSTPVADTNPPILGGIPDDTLTLGAANATDEPRNDASFSLLFEAELSGTEVVDPVSTRAGGNVSISMNKTTGELSGYVGHTLFSATEVALYSAAAGDNGPMVMMLVAADQAGTKYEVPAGSVLSNSQRADLEAGNLYVLVKTQAHPDGELRAQLSGEEVSVSINPTLADLQTKVFAPVCSACHIGGGSTLPSIMNFTTAADTYESLVNVVSLEVPELARVTPGSAATSYIVHKVEGSMQEGARMPFRGTPLSAEQIGAIRQWIDNGALQ